VQPSILQPVSELGLGWSWLPEGIKIEAEMAFFTASSEICKVYGIDPTGSKAGVSVLVRTDGVVGMIAELEGVEEVLSFLKRIIKLT